MARHQTNILCSVLQRKMADSATMPQNSAQTSDPSAKVLRNDASSNALPRRKNTYAWSGLHHAEIAAKTPRGLAAIKPLNLDQNPSAPGSTSQVLIRSVKKTSS